MSWSGQDVLIGDEKRHTCHRPRLADGVLAFFIAVTYFASGI
jgi:hypothetical protein